MGATRRSAPPAPAEPQAAAEAPAGRHWYIDEVIVAAFAFLGVGGAVFLPLHYSIPPITTSFLLATGLAALTYRFLGGIQGASFTVGSLKLGGALAALVGIAMLIDHALAAELAAEPQREVWQVSGQVLDDQGNPIQVFDPGDIAIQPSTVHTGLEGKFQVTVTSWPDINGTPQFPTLSIVHGSYKADSIDLNPSAKNDVSVTRKGKSIVVGAIKLQKLAGYNPIQPLKPVPSDAGTQTPTPPPEHNPTPEQKP
jgi:hypothetical protein